jgi:hypothetical protein
MFHHASSPLCCGLILPQFVSTLNQSGLTGSHHFCPDKLSWIIHIINKSRYLFKIIIKFT